MPEERDTSQGIEERDASEEVNDLLSDLLRAGAISDYPGGLITNWSMVGECIDNEGGTGWFILGALDSSVGDQLKHAIVLDEVAREDFRDHYRDGKGDDD